MAVTVKKAVIGAIVVLIIVPVLIVVMFGLSFHAMMSSYAPNRITDSIISHGETREYLLYVPSRYDPAKPTPLVISTHGAALWPSTQQEVTQWNTLADELGFIVVYPAGTTLSGAGTGRLPFRVWLLTPDRNAMANVMFISDLIDTLEAGYNIDPARIYANGFSNGGAMTFALSCRLADRIAAVGTVSAAQDQVPSSWCAGTRPVPLINFHGADEMVPYEGGTVWMSPKPFPSVLTWTAEWAQRNACGPTPVDSVVAPDVTRLEYTHCADSATVLLYTIKDGGHAWPGGKPMPEWLVGHSTRSIDASRLMWAFFLEHPLPKNRQGRVPLE